LGRVTEVASVQRADAIEAAVALARRVGFPVTEPVVLASRDRLTIHLAPQQVVAKIAPLTQRSRMDRELQVARHLVDNGSPVIPPVHGAVAGPHIEAAMCISFWQFIPSMRRPPDAEEAAGRLYPQLRPGLDTFKGQLPSFWEAVRGCERALDENLPPLLSQSEREVLLEAFANAHEHLERYALREVPLHGDPHPGNLRFYPGGALWHDFESACSGPLEWDLSALPSTPTMLWHSTSLLEVFRLLRSACVVVWCCFRFSVGPAEREAIAFHLERLRAEARGPTRPCS